MLDYIRITQNMSWTCQNIGRTMSYDFRTLTAWRKCLSLTGSECSPRAFTPAHIFLSFHLFCTQSRSAVTVPAGKEAHITLWTRVLCCELEWLLTCAVGWVMISGMVWTTVMAHWLIVSCFITLLLSLSQSLSSLQENKCKRVEAFTLRAGSCG